MQTKSKNFKYYYLVPSGEWVLLEYGKPYNNFIIDHELMLLIENKNIKYEIN